MHYKHYNVVADKRLSRVLPVVCEKNHKVHDLLIGQSCANFYIHQQLRLIVLVLLTEDCCCRQNEHFCTSRDIARQASTQTMCVSSEWSSLVSFDPIFVEIFRFCNRLIP